MNYNDVEILFVDDSPDDAVLALRALKKSGFADKLLHVKDGAEALDFLYCSGTYASRTGRKHPKLILLDLKMPKLLGMEVLEKIKSDPGLKSIPVVILTSSNEESDVQKCYALGANSYVTKPVESDSFFKTIKDIGFYWMVLSQLPG
jgi:CheY-like chemotaxis protein